MSRVSFLLGCAAIFASCAHIPPHQDLRPSDLLITEEASDAPPKSLSKKDIDKDISLAVYALKRAYGGRNFVPQGQMQAAISSLEAIRAEEGLSPKELCKKIGEALGKIQDMHLRAKLGDSACVSPFLKERRATVGKNSHGKIDPPWAKSKIFVSGRVVPVISITAFPPAQDESWKGFLDAVRGLKKTAPAIILDLRGNGGGDDTTGSLMAEILYGQKFPSPVFSQVKSRTPETLAIRLNVPVSRIDRLKRSNKEVPGYWLTKLSSARRDYEESLAGKLPEEKEELSDSGPEFDPGKGFNKPVILLVDAECASSCESILDFMENHPKAVTIGENTGGFIHFGNLGLVALPRSKIVVQMASDYWKYKDGRFIEGKGIAPGISVPAGEDAMSGARSYLEQAWRKQNRGRG